MVLQKIKLKFGEKSGVTEFETKYGLSSFDIAGEEALNFTPDQSMYLVILALETEDKKVRVELVPDESLPDTSTTTKKSLELLLAHKDKVFNVIVKDSRDELCEDLTDEEKKVIEDRFKEFDTDNDGTITTKEVTLYYEKKRDKQIEGFRKIREMMLQCDASNKQDVDSKYDARVKNAEKVCQQEIDYFLNLDVDNSGQIDKEEFFRHEARQMAVMRKGKK